MRLGTLAALVTAFLLVGCAGLRAPSTDPTRISTTLDALTGPAATGCQRAARAGALVAEIDRLSGGTGHVEAELAGALAWVQVVETDPQRTIGQAYLAQAALLTLAQPHLVALHPDAAAVASPAAVLVYVLDATASTSRVASTVRRAMREQCPSQPVA